MLIIGNWKMHGLREESRAKLKKTKILIKNVPARVKIVVCPPFTLLSEAAKLLDGTSVALGAQDCCAETSGAFTGDISAGMLKDLGCAYVIVGHSERRKFHHEGNVLISRKAMAAHRNGLVAILCIGEARADRDAGRTIDIISAQLDLCVPTSATGKNTVIAYEPVWAIGSGRTPSPGEISDVHLSIREHPRCRKMQVLYGGSVMPENASAILSAEGVDGALVGRASLDPESFSAIACDAGKL